MFGLEHKQFPSTLPVPIYTAFHKFKHWQTQGLDHLHVIFHVWSIWLLTARLLLCMLFSKTDSPKFIRCHRGARFTYIWQYILKYQIPHPVLEEAFTLRTTVNNDFSFCLHPAWIRGMFIHATEPGWSDYTATGCGAQPDFFFYCDNTRKRRTCNHGRTSCTWRFSWEKQHTYWVQENHLFFHTE